MNIVQLYVLCSALLIDVWRGISDWEGGSKTDAKGEAEMGLGRTKGFYGFNRHLARILVAAIFSISWSQHIKSEWTGPLNVSHGKQQHSWILAIL